MDVSASSTVQALTTTAAPMLRAPSPCVALEAPVENAFPVAVAAGANADAGESTGATAKSLALNTPLGMQVLDPSATASEIRLFERRSHLQFIVDSTCVEAERLRSESTAGGGGGSARVAASAHADANERAEQRSIALAESHGRRW